MYDPDLGLLGVDADEKLATPRSYCATCDMPVVEPYQADYHRYFDHDVWQAD